VKLADYEIREAVSRKDWSAAVAALARHYGVDMPPEYRMDVMRGMNLFQVEIYLPERAYAWCETKGFTAWHRRHGNESRMSAADIWIR